MKPIQIINHKVVAPVFPTTLTTRQRLRYAVRKWKAIEAYILAVGNADNLRCNGVGTCALCAKYWYRNACEGCPVMKKTGRRYCVGTPIENFAKSSTLAHATAAVKFLKSLVKP